nr:uncharacterized protein LOC111426774 [Onthophagus taurus]
MSMRKSEQSEALTIRQNIITFCENEKAAGRYSFCVDQVISRVAAMTGKSERTIRRIKLTLCNKENEPPQAEAQSSSMDIVKTSFVKRSPQILLDDTDRCVLRNKIHSLYTVDKTVPTLNVLHAFMVNETQFKGSKETLRKILIDMGFKYKKTNDELGENKIPVVYLDESYVHKNYTVSKCWQGPDEHGVLKKDGAGQRWIIAHCGGSMGFIKNGFLLFKSKTKSGDYHDEMNFENFSKWFKTQVLPNLPDNSIIVMDNAPYHSVQIHRPPTSSSKKNDIICWLQSMNIPYHPQMLKCELLEIVRRYKPSPQYVIDEYAKSKGHTVLRLPPYHCDLNPIELIWSMVKRKIASGNIGLINMENLIHEAVNQITPLTTLRKLEMNI